MRTALIGHTGFVGSNLLLQTDFTDVYNSKNIDEIGDKKYDLVISAGNSSLMWMANKEPEKDLKNIHTFINSIKNVRAKRFILISTVEVYDNSLHVNEDSIIDENKLTPYGLHRLHLEKFIEQTFNTHSIIRMPNLYGENLKKNFVYDLIHNNRLDFTHKDSIQQWYNLKHLWKDIQTAMTNDLSVINFAVEPISCHELAKYTLGITFTTITKNLPRKYDMQCKYGKLFHSHSPYLYAKTDTLKELKNFMIQERSLL